MTAATLLPLVFFVPLVGSILSAMLPRRGRIAVTFAAAAGSGAVAVAIAAVVLETGTVRVELAGWVPPLGIALVADGASAVMLLLSATVVPAVALVGAAERKAVGHPAFWPLAGAAAAAVNGVFVAGDLFTLYVMLELLTLSAVALVALGGGGATAPALRYLFVAVTGSLLYLLAVALVYGEAGTVDLALAAERMQNGPVLAAVLALVAVGMAAKSALFPLHAWLPVAHPAAPAAVSALLSALVIKASLFVLWRVVIALGPASEVTGILASAIGVAGAAAVVWGGILALRRTRLKTIIAYSTVAQVGYLVLLLPLVQSPEGAQEGFTGGILLAVAHGLAKAAMFLAAGALVFAYGSDRLDRMEGAISRMPVAVAAIGLAGVSLAGLPPLFGFVGKWLMLQASLAEGAWWWIALLLAGGLLAFGYTGRIIRATFNPPGQNDAAPPRGHPHALFSAVPFALAVLSIVLGLFPGVLVEILAATPVGGGAR